MKLKDIIIRVDHNRRIRLYPQGGLDLECKVDGIGYVLDNDADIAEDLLLSLFVQVERLVHAQVQRKVEVC